MLDSTWTRKEKDRERKEETRGTGCIQTVKEKTISWWFLYHIWPAAWSTRLFILLSLFLLNWEKKVKTFPLCDDDEKLWQQTERLIGQSNCNMKFQKFQTGKKTN